MLNSLLKRALGLERTVIEGARIEGDSIIVSVRPRRAAPRCPVCGRRCAAYDRLGPRRWRAPDLGAARCYLEHAPVRASCPEHGVRTAPVPWARCVSATVKTTILTNAQQPIMPTQSRHLRQRIFTISTNAGGLRFDRRANDAFGRSGPWRRRT